MNKKKKIFVIIAIAILLSIVCLIPTTVRSFKKVKYIADLLTGEKAEEEISTDDLIEAFVDKKNPAIYRKYAASKLGHEIKSPSAVEPLIRVLRDKTEHELIRGEAAFTLGLIGDKRAIEPLLEALNDKNDEVQINSLIGLVKFKDERIIKLLLTIINSENPDKRSIAASGLTIDTPEVISALIKLIKNDPNFNSKHAAVEALGETKTKNEEAFQILLEVLDRKYVEENYDNSDRRILRKSAAIALGKIGDERAVEPLIKILERDEEIYVQAAIALGELGDKRAIEPLKKRMEEKENKEYIMKDLNETYRKLTE